MSFEPFVVLWRAQTRTPPRVARTCFERVRVHHPNALVLIFRDGEVDLTYVDERCHMVRDLCSDDVTAWHYFSEQASFGAGLLLHDNLFIGSRPFPPFLQNQFLWRENPDRPGVSFRAEPSNEIISFHKPLELMGYFRRSFLQRMPRDPVGFAYVAHRIGVGFMFGYEPCITKKEECLDALLLVDVPVFCRIL
jgi:hypothetical protein